MNRPTFAAVKFSLLLMALATLLALTAAAWSHHQMTQAEQALATARQTVAQARLHLLDSRQQQQLVTTHLARYQALAARGFIGPEARLAWIEAVQLANREAGLYGLDYRLDPRQSERRELAQGLPLGYTAMTITLPLLVETDLTRFLAALQQRAPGLMRVHGCRLTRLANAPFTVVNLPQLQAECELWWYTLALPRGRP